MAVRAKFKVIAKNQTQPVEFLPGGESPVYIPTKVTMAPVMVGPGEDSIFGKLTPGGLLEMQLQNDAAASQLEVGRNYYITIESEFAVPQPVTPAATPEPIVETQPAIEAPPERVDSPPEHVEGSNDGLGGAGG